MARWKMDTVRFGVGPPNEWAKAAGDPLHGIIDVAATPDVTIGPTDVSQPLNWLWDKAREEWT